MEPEVMPSAGRWCRQLLDEKHDALADAFVRHGVVAVYVFGSLARDREPGKVTDRSDLDLAVLFPDGLTEDDRWRRARRLEPELWDILARGDIDLVVANDAPMVLRHHIVRERDVIRGRDTPERVGFDWRTFREYLDTEPLRRIRYAAALRRARDGRFGVRPRTGTAPAR